MDGCHVTIRLLDPPLHEFLPNGDMHDVCEMMASELGVEYAQVVSKIDTLSEVNPMLGLRGYPPPPPPPPPPAHPRAL
jgi:pyruvate,orthophosphate dikinase